MGELPKVNMCEFAKECLHYQSSSYTCNEGGGGDYCGKWRDFVSSRMNVTVEKKRRARVYPSLQSYEEAVYGKLVSEERKQ